MADDFDGYRKWLGVTSKKRPPTHYELLGIMLDEDDPDVIRAAATQRRQFVESMRGEGHDAVVTEILYRIGEAEVTLLNSEMRRDYDRQLDLFEKRRKSRQVDPNASRSRVKSQPGRTVGEDGGIVKTFAGIMAIVCVAFGVMAWFSFQLPWEKKTDQQAAAPGIEDAVDVPVAALPPFKTPAFQKWLSDVAKMSPETQITAVIEKLKELNPGFDGNLIVESEWVKPSRIENGVVVELNFLTDHVTDISPVRALTGLKILGVTGSNNNLGKLSDLSPLQGMNLTTLYCGKTQITDLTPLKGMPITHLWINDLNLSDLSPLRGLPLMDFRCQNTKISDLSPLRGKQLHMLSICYSKVSDLSPLQGMPLGDLGCRETPVTDLSPLQDLRLRSIWFTPKNITKGIDAIRQMKSIETVYSIGDMPSPVAEFWRRYDAGEFGVADKTTSSFKSIFDGNSLNGWVVTPFRDHGEVIINNGCISLGTSNGSTGITLKKDFPKLDYEVIVEAKRVEGNDFFCGLTFPVGDSTCSLIVGGWGGTVVGLSSIDGRDASQNETTKNMQFDTDRWYAIRLSVTASQVKVWIDDSQVIDQSTVGHKISIRPEIELSKPFGICSWKTKAALRNIKWRQLKND